MTERLDPELIKEIMSRIFAGTGKIAEKYKGTIERFFGDEIMMLFGVPEAHDDDPVRAIHAARDIHDLVAAMSPEFEERNRVPLRMHTGISTGLVVTGDEYIGKSRHGLTGDTINLAKRLTGIAEAGAIIVASDTYRQSEGFFSFMTLDPAVIKGKAEPVRIYKVLSLKQEPSKIRRLSGLRADLVGRESEMAKLKEAVKRLKQGKGSVVSICGDAGTGKSRLVEEFKATLNPEEILWRQGHAYAYSQNIPYYPLIDFLNHSFQIMEQDSDQVKKKVEAGISSLLGDATDIIPYVGSLYSISYPEIEKVSPEFWKARLHEAIKSILSALARRSPLVVCFEDLHWADSSFLELLHFVLSDFEDPILFLCIFRPTLTLLTSRQINALTFRHLEIRPQDLSPGQSRAMVESLLHTDNIPHELERIIKDKVEGNPFYIEEVINSLLESGALFKENGTWRLAKDVTGVEISSTIHGVISARLDRLERESKKVILEASVIGRSFFFTILRRITELQGDIDQYLNGLEQLDLIKTKAFQPDIEFIFKHALTQEVAYNCLLKKDRKTIHERVGLVMEELFKDRLPEFYETLALHFKQGKSISRAVYYLIKSGERSLEKFALDESHKYFQDAYTILSSKSEKTEDEKLIFINLLIKWAQVYNYRGDFKGLSGLFRDNEAEAESLENKETAAIFYFWLGQALGRREMLIESHEILLKALKIGEETGDQKAIGYACTGLCWTCADMGLLGEAVLYGNRAQEISMTLQEEQTLYVLAFSGVGMAYFMSGYGKQAISTGQALLDRGQKTSDLRSTAFGHVAVGMGYFASGDYVAAIESLQTAIEMSMDPVILYGSKTILGMSYINSGRFQEAQDTFDNIMQFGEGGGAEMLETVSQLHHGMAMAIRGHMNQGIENMQNALKRFSEIKSRYRHAMAEYLLGKLYLSLVLGPGSKSPSFWVRNMIFLVKNVPFAGRKAKRHLNNAVKVAGDIGAKQILGLGYFDLGLLYKAREGVETAREYFLKAMAVFEETEAEFLHRNAQEALGPLKNTAIAGGSEDSDPVFS